jgi:hypothetical protein
MPIAIYLLLLPACSLTMGLLGFFVGRCARKLPIIDDNLPWTMHRSQMPFAVRDGQYLPISAKYPGDSGPDWASMITDSRNADQTLCAVAGKLR